MVRVFSSSTTPSHLSLLPRSTTRCGHLNSPLMLPLASFQHPRSIRLRFLVIVAFSPLCLLFSCRGDSYPPELPLKGLRSITQYIVVRPVLLAKTPLTLYRSFRYFFTCLPYWYNGVFFFPDQPGSRSFLFGFILGLSCGYFPFFFRSPFLLDRRANRRFRYRTNDGFTNTGFYGITTSQFSAPLFTTAPAECGHIVPPRTIISGSLRWSYSSLSDSAMTTPRSTPSARERTRDTTTSRVSAR